MKKTDKPKKGTQKTVKKKKKVSPGPPSKKKKKKAKRSGSKHMQKYGYEPIPSPTKEVRLTRYLPLVVRGMGFQAVARHLQYNVETVKSDFKRLKKVKVEGPLPPDDFGMLAVLEECFAAPTVPHQVAIVPKYDWQMGHDRMGMISTAMTKLKLQEGDMVGLLMWMQQHRQDYRAKTGALQVQIYLDQRNQELHVTFDERDSIMKRLLKRVLPFVDRSRWIELKNSLQEEFKDD